MNDEETQKNVGWRVAYLYRAVLIVILLFALILVLLLGGSAVYFS